ncbi:odorant receptor 45a-like [Belonocnema kinseyi]|uniref:odorant receptor 45a-like n=1 Tax=Belonocnema kinseyi TaxID=2817044 RepID=UPI00143DF7D1|nr:odorant receptor 45a-like [Belonocnema kinseyi]
MYISARSNTMILLSLYVFTILLILLTPLSKKSNFPLPFKVWIPCGLESRPAYFLTYLHQVVAALPAAIITASVESLASVIVLQICAQLEIIAHRLHLLPLLQKKNYCESIIYKCESSIVKNCVNRHIDTYMLGEKLNESFGPVVFIQSLTTVLSLCVAIYPLSHLDTSIFNLRTWSLIVPLSSVLSQMFLYCFYGEKLIEESMAIKEEVYHIDWIETTIKTNKKLALIMVRAGKPMKFTAFSLIIMTIDTFVKVLRWDRDFPEPDILLNSAMRGQQGERDALPRSPKLRNSWLGTIRSYKQEEEEQRFEELRFNVKVIEAEPETPGESQSQFNM